MSLALLSVLSLFVPSVVSHGNTTSFPATVSGLAQTFEGHLAVPFGCGINLDDMPEDSPSLNLAALWLRAAFHDVGKYDPLTNATVAGLLPTFLNEKENDGIGLSIATHFASKYKFNYSSADFIAIAGQVTVTHCGGPSFNFSVGRVDAPSGTKFSSLPNLLPDDELDSYQVIKQKLYRLGLNNEDIVALVSGSHTMGGVHAAISPKATNKTFEAFDTTPGIFDNDIFKQSLKGNCRLKVDCNIAKDPELRPIVELFALDQAAFFKQYALSYPKLTSIGQNSNGWASFHLDLTVHENLMKEGGVNPPGFNVSTLATPSSVTTSSKSAAVGIFGMLAASIWILAFSL
ncbi:hypothetical protein HDU79_012059 [Rhizoclosmatium sp. JEL0117]|nr:hypothetical protein HDU79_012059 [Rhizoclosmatium sp. JEL0117]